MSAVSPAPIQALVHSHPLQRLSSPSRSLSAALHILGLSSFAYSFNWLHQNPNEINSAYGWHFQYLTIIGLSLATVTFLLGLGADITLNPTLFRAKNILSICSAPLEVLISLLYWGLRAINPALVVPPEFELPLTADLSFHFAPSLCLAIDLLFFSPPWTITLVPATAISGFIAVGYWYWIELCFTKNGFYPYPIFELLDSKQRLGLFVGSAVVMGLVTVALKSVYGVVNGREMQRLVDGEQKRGERPGQVAGKRKV